MTPPYAADTRAKGWRFELDHERIRQSDTWALATPEQRPWLLMLWMTAWEQTPCGSLPNDDALIAARIGMPLKTFSKHRSVLMRSWQIAEDGRLYHPTITERVLELVERRVKETARRAAYRERMLAAATVPQLSHGTTMGRTTPEPEPEPVKEKEKEKPRKRDAPRSIEKPESVQDSTWADWLQLRKAKRAPVTATVLAQAEAEALKAGMTLDAFLAVWCARGSQGLEASWLKDDKSRKADLVSITTPGPSPSSFLADQAAHRAQVERERQARKQAA